MTQSERLDDDARCAILDLLDRVGRPLSMAELGLHQRGRRINAATRRRLVTELIADGLVRTVRVPWRDSEGDPRGGHQLTAYCLREADSCLTAAT